MAYDDIFQPRIYKAWNEAIIKEKKVRMKWHADYGSKLLQNKTSPEKLIQDEEPEPPCICKDKSSSIPDTQFKMDWPRKGAVGTNTLIREAETHSDMVPPTPIVRGILYAGISRDGKGRAGYLKRRWQSDPEKRFHNPICTSWMCGWNYGKPNELSCKDAENCNIREIAFGFN